MVIRLGVHISTLNEKTFVKKLSLIIFLFLFSRQMFSYMVTYTCYKTAATITRIVQHLPLERGKIMYYAYMRAFWAMAGCAAFAALGKTHLACLMFGWAVAPVLYTYIDTRREKKGGNRKSDSAQSNA